MAVVLVNWTWTPESGLQSQLSMFVLTRGHVAALSPAPHHPTHAPSRPSIFYTNMRRHEPCTLLPFPTAQAATQHCGSQRQRHAHATQTRNIGRVSIWAADLAMPRSTARLPALSARPSPTSLSKSWASRRRHDWRISKQKRKNEFVQLWLSGARVCRRGSSLGCHGGAS